MHMHMNKLLLIYSKAFLFILTFFLFSNAFSGEDKLNAIINTISQKLHQLEIKHHAEIGLSAIQTYNNTHIDFNADRCVPMDNALRKKLQHWLKHCKTGSNRIHAGIPRHYADGSIGYASVVCRAHASPIVLTMHVRQNEKNAHASDQIITQATRIVVNAMTALS